MEIEPKAQNDDQYFVFVSKNLVQLEKSLQTKDQRHLMQMCATVEKHKKSILPHHVEFILNLLNVKHNIDFSSMKNYVSNFDFELTKSQFQEVQQYLKTIALIYLTRNRKSKEGLELSEMLVKQLKQMIHMSVLQSIVYFYRSQCFEQQNDLKTFREELMEAYRLSCINKQEVLQAMLYNLILRNYLNYNNYEAANHFLNKTSFPESVQNNEFTKYLYYSAKIKVIQMDYQGAYSNLLQAIRKSPDNLAVGFKTQVYKLIVITELLLGEIPSRALFSNAIFKNQLLIQYLNQQKDQKPIMD